MTNLGTGVGDISGHWNAVPSGATYLLATVTGTKKQVTEWLNCDGTSWKDLTVNASVWMDFYDSNNSRIGSTITFSSDTTDYKVNIPSGTKNVVLKIQYVNETKIVDNCYHELTASTTSQISITFYGYV